MILYLDTSSLLKLFVEEEGSESVRQMAREADSLASSLVAYAEMRAAVARLKRTARLTEETYQGVLENFRRSWVTFNARAVTEDLVRVAGDLAEKHLLRGFDAIHLASALALQEESGEPISFSAWDDRLMAAAAAEGLTPTP